VIAVWGVIKEGRKVRVIYWKLSRMTESYKGATDCEVFLAYVLECFVDKDSFLRLEGCTDRDLEALECVGVCVLTKVRSNFNHERVFISM
jgi:hypothetical protein